MSYPLVFGLIFVTFAGLVIGVVIPLYSNISDEIIGILFVQVLYYQLYQHYWLIKY